MSAKDKSYKKNNFDQKKIHFLGKFKKNVGVYFNFFRQKSHKPKKNMSDHHGGNLTMFRMLQTMIRGFSITGVMNSCLVKIASYLGVLNFIKQRQFTTLTYLHDNTRYSLIFPNKRGPRKWITVETETGTDITDVVVSASGPYHNFHGIPTTPEMMGYHQSLTFHLNNGTTKTIKYNETISF